MLTAVLASAVVPAWGAPFGPYSNTTSGFLPDQVDCATELAVEIEVTDSFQVNDLDVGLNITHSYRGDVRVMLTSPEGTTAVIIARREDNNNNYDFLLDDESANPLDDDLDAVIGPPNYGADRIAAPSNPLSVFDGEQAEGTWTLSFCNVPFSGSIDRDLTFNSAQLEFDGDPGRNYTVDNTSPGTLTVQPDCTTPLVRTFNVTGSFSIDDLNVGLNVDHTYRGDLQVQLTSPATTTVTLIAQVDDGDNNYDLLLDDESGGAIDDGTDNDTATPIYGDDRAAAPDNPLSAFDGEDALGTWTLSICNVEFAGSGGRDLTFNRARLDFLGTPDVASTGIGGNVFRDHNFDALLSLGEPGVQSVAVTAYDAAGAAIATDTTDAAGHYVLTGLAAATTYRLEFTAVPAYLQPMLPTVRFVTSGTAAQDLPLANPAHFYSFNSRLITPCYESGTGVGNANPGLVSWSYNAIGVPAGFADPAGGTAQDPRKDGNIEDIGTVWGTAYQPDDDRLFLASFLKRHSGFKDGPGYIYVVDYSGGGPPFSFSSFNLQGVAPGNGGPAIDLGSVTRTPGNPDTELFADPTTRSIDLDAFAKVGAISYGDADLQEDGNTLWVVNLFQRALITVDVSGSTGSLPGTVNQYPLGAMTVTLIDTTSTTFDAMCAGKGVMRPFGLEFHDGVGYLGVVCDASTTQARNDLTAHVFSFDPATVETTGLQEELNFDLDYNRENGQAYGGSPPPLDHSQWDPWASTWAQLGPVTNATPNESGDNNYMGPQPIVSDLEIGDDGSIAIGLLDRFGHQNGRANRKAISGDSSSIDTTALGDIIHACRVNGVFVVENGADCLTEDDNEETGTPGDTLRQDDGVGNGGEYYHEDGFREGPTLQTYTHGEVAQGALARLPGSGVVVSTHVDPLWGSGATNSQGTVWYDMTTGDRESVSGTRHEYMVVERSPATPGTFAKSNGIGDLELMGAPAAIEIGDRVWDDTDGDGIQDPGEPGIAGVTVQLIDTDGTTVIATAVTDANGDYLFSNGAGTDTASAKYNLSSLTAETNGFRLRVALGQGALSGKLLSPPNNPDTGAGDGGANADARDSDGGFFGANAEAPVNTGPSGDNDYDYDFGFAPIPPTRVGLGNLIFRDNNLSGTYDAGEEIDGVTVELYAAGDTPGADPPLASMVTANGGCYAFTGLALGTYFVHIPANEFAAGEVLDGHLSASPEGGDTQTDDDLDENGLNAAAPSVTGVSSGDIVLMIGGEPTGGAETGKNASDDDAQDANIDFTVDLGFTPPKALTYGDWVTQFGLTGIDDDPVDSGGGEGNPDKDIYDNLLEYALCLHPENGGQLNAGLCAELNSGSDEIEVFYERPTGITDVTYTLEGSEDLASWTAITSIAPTVTPNGDGTEEVRFVDLESIAGGPPENIDLRDKGFVRLKVDLASPVATDYTQVFGWERTTFRKQCETCSIPFVNKPTFSGIVDSMTGSDLEAALSAGFTDVSSLMLPAVEYYVEILDGTDAGHRFDVDEAGSDADTIAIDTGSAHNTQSPVPDLSGDSFILRAHDTLDALFDKTKFTGDGDPDVADRLLFRFGGAWTVFYLLDAPLQWTQQGEVGMPDRGDRVVDPCEGIFLHPRAADVELVGIGMVRANAFACPLETGYNFVRGGWPLHQSPDDRDMALADGFFFGGTDPAAVDQLHFWKGDSVLNAEGYNGSWLLDAGAPYQYWTGMADPGVTDEDASVLFQSNRSAQIRVTSDRLNYVMPLPWTP